MAIEKVERYRASNGRLFRDLSAAEAYDDFLAAEKAYGKDPISAKQDDVNWKDFVDWIRWHRDIVKKVLDLPVDPWEPNP